MAAPLEHPSDEIKRLRRCINDLVSVLALPAMWSGFEPIQIVRNLLEVLLNMLQLDLVYVRLEDRVGPTPIEMVRTAQQLNLTASPREMGELLSRSLGDDPKKMPPLRRTRMGDADMSLVPSRMGLEGAIGVIVAGSQRLDFPGQTETLLLSVAANQAAIWLQGAQLLSEQKRVATELDHRVARRTAELAAANEALQLQAGLLQHIPVAAWTLRPDGTPDFVSRNWLEYAGRTLADIQSDPAAWMSAIHPDDQEAVSRSFWDGIRSGQGFTSEARFRRALDGAYRWHLNRGVALRGTEGNVLRFVGTSTDIEDLKQSQENLRKAEEKTRLIIDTALDPVITMDAQGTVTSWNKQAESVFGWSNREAIGQHMSELIIPPQHRFAHERGLRHFLATGDGPLLRRRIEVTALRRSGVEFPVELEIVPIRLGQDWVFSAFLRDIAESKLAAQKLRESELELRQMTETIPQMLWRATADGAIDYCNARLLDYTGFPAEAIMGDGWPKLLHPDDVDPAAREWASCVTTGAPYRVEVRTFHAADRTYRWCVSNALPLRDQDGRIRKWHGTIVDMHDWKQAQEKLRHAQAELAHVTRVTTLGELTASIAHEVNQPLGSVINNANACLNLLANGAPQLSEVRDALAEIIQGAEQASAVLSRVRQMVRKAPSERTVLKLRDIVADVLSLARHDTAARRVMIRLELTDDMPPIQGDRVQLQQVLINLIVNGMDAMNATEESKRILTIWGRPETREGESRCLLGVQDAGTGLNPDGMNQLFEAFYTTKPHGMGMGLAISRSIIEAHGGRLWAEANHERGATFLFSLPDARSASA